MNILLLSQGIELKAQTDIAKKRYQKLDNMLVFDKTFKEKTLANYSKSNLIYNSNDSFYKYDRDSKKIDKMFRKLNYFFLAELFREKKYLKTKREKTKRKKTHVYDTPSEFYYKFQERWIQ